MKKLRVVASIVGTLLLTLWVLGISWSWNALPHFSFFWNVLRGLALGLLLAMLPIISGTASARLPYRAQWWIGAALIVLVLFFQFLMGIGSLSVSWLRWLSASNVQILMGEGVVLGYVLGFALRAKK